MALHGIIPACVVLISLISIGNSNGLSDLSEAECTPGTYPINSTIEPATFTTPLTDLRWLAGQRHADKYVFALTGGKGFEAGGEVYRSDDFGSAASWRNISDELEGLLDPPAAAAEHPFLRFLRGAIEIHHTPRTTERVLIQGVGHHNWYSEDFGTLWTKVDSPGKSLGWWTTIKMHPNKTDWLLAHTKRGICWHEEFQGGLDKACVSDLFVSQDFGRSWMNLTENSAGRIASFVDFDWGAHLNPWFGATKEDAEDPTIFATVYEDAKHLKGPLPGWDHNVHYIRSDDFFKTAHEKIVSCGNVFDIRSHKVYLAVPSNCPFHPDGSKRKLSGEEAVSSSVLLYVSEDRGISFKEACIPVGDLDLGYELRENFFGGGATLIANHGQQDVVTGQSPVANVYSTGGEGGLYSLSFSRVFRRGPHTDYVNIEGLPGVHIANELNPIAFAQASVRGLMDESDLEKFLGTRVSYNGGSDWHRLEKPVTFNHPSCDSCSHEANVSWMCQLHLHGPTSWRSTEGKKPALHSHWSAPGVVMAVGNTGEFLDTSADVSCTYLSTDGGESWQDVADHANVFEFGDHGGILVMARHQTQGPASYIQFSMDHGSCWHRVNLSEAIDIIDIRVEPTAASQVFLVYGKTCAKSDWHPTCTHTEEGTKPKGKLYSLDFEKILGNDWKLCGDADYEKWSVPTPERCLLGRNITMTRRKADAACFNGKGWERPEGLDHLCDCTTADVECEYGYQWSGWHQQCIEIGGMTTNACPAVASHKYIISDTHLRLLSGDACKNISTLIPDTDGRGHSTLPNKSSWIRKAVIVVVAVLGTVAVVAVLAQLLKQRNGSGGGSLLAAPAAAVGGAIDWIKSKVTGQPRPEEGYSQPLSGDIDDFDVDEEDARSP